jgi:biopolymer transport protein ExbD
MHHSRIHRPRTASAEVNLGFQIAPMIDVVFVIMLFFMVMAGSLKKEKLLSLKLPSCIQSTEVKMPDAEQSIRVAEDGSLALNDEVLVEGSSTQFGLLDLSLARLSQQSKAAQDKLLFTLDAEPTAQYERVAAVLNLLAKHDLQHVTFTVGQ